MKFEFVAKTQFLNNIFGALVLTHIIIFNTAPAASKDNALFKTCQNQLKNNQLALLIQICDTLCRC